MSRIFGNQEKLRRAASSFLSRRIQEGEVELIVVDQSETMRVLRGNLTPIFENMDSIGEGSQGVVYAVLARFLNEQGEIENRRCVLKKLTSPQKNCLSGSSSTSTSSSYTSSSEITLSAPSIFVTPAAFSAHDRVTHGVGTSTKHNIIKLIAVIEDEGGEYALLPYCDFFLDAMIDNKLLALAALSADAYYAAVLDVISNVLDAILHMFDRNYVHRDINPRNIAFYQGRWCLLDLDCAVETGKALEESSFYKGAPYYTHPAGFVYGNKTAHVGNDLYALGETLKQLLFREKSFQSENFSGISKEKEVVYKKALYDSGKLPAGDIEVDGLSLHETLFLMADRMCSPLYSHQPNLVTLSETIKALRSALSKSSEGVDEIVHAFYEELASEDCFSALSSSDVQADVLLSSFSGNQTHVACSQNLGARNSLDSHARSSNSAFFTSLRDDENGLSDSGEDAENPLKNES